MSPEEYRENTYLYKPEELDIDVSVSIAFMIDYYYTLLCLYCTFK